MEWKTSQISCSTDILNVSGVNRYLQHFCTEFQESKIFGRQRQGPIFATFLHRISKDRSKNFGRQRQGPILQHFCTEFQEIRVKKFLGVNGKDRFWQRTVNNMSRFNMSLLKLCLE